MNVNQKLAKPVKSIALGGSDLKLSQITYGVWRLNDQRQVDSSASLSKVSEVSRLIEHCLSLGITTFDHADIYGDYQCEALFGSGFAESRLKRDQIQLVSKCGIKLVSKNRSSHKIKSYDSSRTHIMQSVEQSLTNLRTDYLDLLLIHRPDYLLDPIEVAETFVELRRVGKVRHFGVSNFTPAQVDALQSHLAMPLLTNQIELNPLNLQALNDGTLDQCLLRRMTPMAWSPLAGGRLLIGNGEQESRVRQVLAKIGKEVGGASIDQVALAWIAKLPANPVIVIGTRDLERISQAARVGIFELSREQWYEIWQASAGREVP